MNSSLAVASPYKNQVLERVEEEPRILPGRKTKAERTAKKTANPNKRNAYATNPRIEISPIHNEDIVRP